MKTLLAEYKVRLYVPHETEESEFQELCDALEDSEIVALLEAAARGVVSAAPIGDVNAASTVTIAVS